METIIEVQPERGFTGFFKHTFNFDETNKALIFNMLQYAILALIPCILALKGIGAIIPEEDEEKGSIEISLEVLGQLMLVLLSIWFINRMVRYIPTYSGVEYAPFNETNFILIFLILMLTMQTRLGEKVKILATRVMDAWEGKTSLKPEEKNTKGNVKVSQPLANQPNQATGPPAAQSPKMMDQSTLGMDGLAQAQAGLSQQQQAHQNAMSQGYQTPDFNSFYQNDLNPMVGANEPMAANDMGSAFGSAW